MNQGPNSQAITGMLIKQILVGLHGMHRLSVVSKSIATALIVIDDGAQVDHTRPHVVPIQRCLRRLKVMKRVLEPADAGLDHGLGHAVVPRLLRKGLTCGQGSLGRNRCAFDQGLEDGLSVDRSGEGGDGGDGLDGGHADVGVVRFVAQSLV